MKDFDQWLADEKENMQDIYSEYRRNTGDLQLPFNLFCWAVWQGLNSGDELCRRLPRTVSLPGDVKAQIVVRDDGSEMLVMDNLFFQTVRDSINRDLERDSPGGPPLSEREFRSLKKEFKRTIQAMFRDSGVEFKDRSSDH